MRSICSALGFVLVSLPTVALGAVALPAVALAHGRPAEVTGVAFDPSHPDRLAARATFGVFSSENLGDSYAWRCAYQLHFDAALENPPVVITPSGHLIVGTYTGLVRTDTTQCDLELPSTRLNDLIIDLELDPDSPQGVYAVASPGDINRLFYSDNEGQTFVERAAFPLGVLLERSAVAPSDGARIYLSGVRPRTDTTPRTTYLWRSIDHGMHFDEVEVPLEENERNLHVLAVDPLNPDRVLARTVRNEFDMMTERALLSTDGGQTFRTLLRAAKISGGVFVVESGVSSVYVGSRLEGLFRSVDGVAMSNVNPASARCLAVRGTDELWMCGDGLAGPNALARVTNDGATLESRLNFANLTNYTGCTVCSVGGAYCPYFFIDVEVDLGRLDASVPLVAPDVGPRNCDAGPLDGGVAFDGGDAASMTNDAGMITPRDGCACSHVQSGRPSRAWYSAWLVLGIALFRRAFRRQIAPLR